MSCACQEVDCLHYAFDYPWCRSCEEHHRPPECPVDEQGRSLAPDGRTWAEHDRELREHNEKIREQKARGTDASLR